MDKIYVGISNGRDVKIAKSSPNQHVIITGISGSGKSVRLTEMEKNIIDNSGTVIAFDINGTHSELDVENCCYISAQEDGLAVEFLDTKLVQENKETMANLVQYVMETICPRELRGACQLAAVRKAINFAIQNKAQFSNEMEAISYGLKEQEDAAASGAFNHLCPILEGEIFRNSSKNIQQGKINVISLKGINPKTQKHVTEIMLSVLWRKMRIEGVCENKFTLVIDEFQNLNFQQNSTLFQMLTEARKYGVNLILATQTLAIFQKRELAIINQAAVKLFFQQSATDVRKMAEMIEPEQREKWILELAQLRVGQAITVGELEIGGRTIYRPIVTYSKYKEQKNQLQQF